MNTQQTILAKLQRDILPLQGYKRPLCKQAAVALGPVNEAFPNNTFPLGAVHEFISNNAEDASATYGFVMGIAAKIAQHTGAILWISPTRLLFPPALVVFGVQPHNIIFLEVKKELDCLWAMEEALKCEAFSTVICESPNISFTASRRFQLAVEQSNVTGFLLRENPRKLTPTATIARWRVAALNSANRDGMPGLGLPRWQVQLLKVRNGKPGTWKLEFENGQFNEVINHKLYIADAGQRKVG